MARDARDRARAELVRRAVREDSGLLAARLARRADEAELPWSGLAVLLGCTDEALDRMALCRPPRPDRFEEDLAEVARLGGVDPDALRPWIGSAEDAAARHWLLAAEERAPYDARENERQKD
jgi:hypothetical protein